MGVMKTVCRWSIIGIIIPISILVYFSLTHPTPDQTEEYAAEAWTKFKSTRAAYGHDESFDLPVMSFNIRLDGLESDPENHWTKRIHRVAALLEEYGPYSVGLQEPFAGQVLHLQSVLPKKWQAVGYRQNSSHDLGHPSRHNDMQVGILYDITKLELLHHHYHWLSNTPDMEGSKNWRSMGIRTLNVAHFRLVNNKDPKDAPVELLHFNTHLDVASEEARREQAKVAIRFINRYRKLYPKAFVVLTGDFNTCVGQAAYQLLTAPNALVDSWKACQNVTDCTIGSDVSHTFHGWIGLRMNSWAGRLIVGGAFTLHGMGFRMPFSVPTTPVQMVRAVVGIISAGPQYPIREALPEWPLDRMHVDWILHQQPYEYESASKMAMSPVFSSVVDVRNTNFSSDHYPVLMVFRGKRARTPS